MTPNLPSQMRVAFSSMARKTGSRSPGDVEMTLSTSAAAVCCFSASERCPRASASSQVRASCCFFNSIIELGSLLTRALAFVPVERSLRPCVWLFAPLRDNETPGGTQIEPSHPGPRKHITAGSLVSELGRWPAGGWPHEQVRWRSFVGHSLNRLFAREGHGLSNNVR